MENPLVSIIVCTYNRAHLLSQTMDSIFAQQYEPVEVVVVDDGSTDNTKELMGSYGDKISIQGRCINIRVVIRCFAFVSVPVI